MMVLVVSYDTVRVKRTLKALGQWDNFNGLRHVSRSSDRGPLNNLVPRLYHKGHPDGLLDSNNTCRCHCAPDIPAVIEVNYANAVIV